MGQMNRTELIIYALECLMIRDEIDIKRYEEMIASGDAKQQDYEWLNFHRKRRAKLVNMIGTINEMRKGNSEWK